MNKESIAFSAGLSIGMVLAGFFALLIIYDIEDTNHKKAIAAGYGKYVTTNSGSVKFVWIERAEK